MNKTAKRCLAILSVCAYLFGAATCAADGGGFTYGGAMDDAGAAGSAATSAETGETEETSEQNSAQEVQRPAGLITAGAWNERGCECRKSERFWCSRELRGSHLPE